MNETENAQHGVDVAKPHLELLYPPMNRVCSDTECSLAEVSQDLSEYFIDNQTFKGHIRKNARIYDFLHKIP